MSSEQTIQLPERLRVVVTLAGLLEKIEADPRAGGADQYRSIVRHLVDELGRLETDTALEWVLGVFPATSDLYENLRYQQAGLCRTPLELSLNSELEARAVIDRASRRKPAATPRLHHQPAPEPDPGLHPVEPDQGQVPPVVPDQGDEGPDGVPLP